MSQSSINAAHDEEFLDLLARSGCQGVLIGFESLNPVALAAMNKSFNTMRGGYEAALANLRRHRLRLYATFIFGYDADTAESFEHATEFAKAHKFYIAAFNHLTPFPGTPLYSRLEAAAPAAVRALVARRPLSLQHGAASSRRPWIRKRFRSSASEARRDFYGWSSIIRRGLDDVNRSDAFMFRSFFPINSMLRIDTMRRDGFPLGDESWNGQLLRAH